MTKTTVLGPSDLFALKYLRDARLSPDGRWAAYSISYTDSVERLEIWIDRLTERSKQRLPFAGDASCPRWSPDGRHLAFIGDGRLRVASFPELRISEPLTPANLSARGAPSWSSDNASLAVSLLERRPVLGLVQVVGHRYRMDGLGSLEGVEQRIFTVNIYSGALHCLTPMGSMSALPDWSPCGQHILYLARFPKESSGSYSPRMFTVDAEGGAICEVLSGAWFIGGARWLPDGNRIGVIGAFESTLTVPLLSVWVVDASGRGAELRSPGLRGGVGFHVHHDMPVWELEWTNSFTIADARHAFFTIQRRGSAEVWRVALEGVIETERILGGERSCIVLDANKRADALLYAVTDLYSPTELRWAALGGAHEERITDLNREVLAGWPPMAVEPFAFISADGVEIEAWSIAARDRRGPFPTVLFIHGGPFSATGHAFRYDFLLLASNGFGIVFANFRGSAGYDESFTRAIMGDWGERAYPDHIGAVDAAVTRGFADPNRLGVWGPSHGGFATCWIVGHTNRFKAAVAEASVTNFITQYYLTDLPELMCRDFGGRPDEIPEVYRSRSPMSYGHRCTTPTMLIHGEEDLRCPIGEAEQFYRLLRDVGCPTELARIPGCSHLGDSIGPLSARRAQNEALLSWFQRHL